jgi:hypothetical protein
MASDPAHLRQGVGAGTERGQATVAPITRLEAGNRPRLPATTLVEFGNAAVDPVSSGSGSPFGGAGVGGASGAR